MSRPSPAPRAQAVIAKRFVSPIPKVGVTRDVPEALDDALTRVLSRTPVDRFATGAQFVEALRLVNGVGRLGPGHRADRSDAARLGPRARPSRSSRSPT